MTLSLYNTLSGRLEPFVPERPPQVRMYVCGPTVYARAHVGNFRTFVATDLLRRTLEYKGYQVLEVMNLTDVEDRIIKFAADAGQDLAAYTAPHVLAFQEDLDALRFERPEVMPKATEHVPEMVALVARLIERGHTYAVDGSVYFRIASFDGLRQAVAPGRRGHQGRRAGRQRPLRQGERARLRALEGEDRRAGLGAVGRALRPRPSGLAPRVLGHGA